MAFWSIGSGGFHSISAVEKILDKEDHTLKDVLDAEDLIHEVLAPNTKLIDYLRQPEIIQQLSDLIIAPDPHSSKDHGPDAGAEDADTAEGAKDAAGAEPEDEEMKDVHDAEEAAIEHNQSDTSFKKAETERKQEEKKETEEAIEKRLEAKFAPAAKDSGDDKPEKAEEADAEHTKDKSEDKSSENEPAEPKEPTESKEGKEGKENDENGENDEHEPEKVQEDSLDLDETLPEPEDLVDYGKLATEILSSDVWCLMDALISTTSAMDKLWGLLDQPEVASTKQLTYITSIFENLLEKRTDQMLEYMRQLPQLTSYFLNYIDNPPLADFLLKIISTDHPDAPTGMIDLLYDQNLIPQLIQRLGPDVSASEQVAVGDFLKAFVTISCGNKGENCSIGPNELSRQLVSQDCMKQLIDLMVQGGSGMCIAVGVIIEIIRKNNSDYDHVQVVYTTLQSHPPNPRDSIYLGTMVRLFAEAIPQFQEILGRPNNDEIEMPLGPVKPLGFERFRICELYAELLHCSNMGLLNEEKGEQVVLERDNQRRRQYHPDAKQESEKPPVSDKEAAEHASKPEEGTKGDEPAESSLQAGGAAASDKKVADDSEPEKMSSPAPIPAQGPPSPQEMYIDSSPKADADAPTGQELLEALSEQEAKIRAKPVVGDRLKLALDDHGCISTVFKMLFEYPWNNFLHNVVFDIVQQVFNGSIQDGYNKFLAIHLFTKDLITDKIVAGQKANDEYEETKHTRLGYVGHLTLISEEVVKFAAVFPPETVSPAIAEALEAPSWTTYVETVLLKLREQYNTILGGHKPDDMDAMDDEDRYSDDSAMEGAGTGDGDNEDDSDQFSRYMGRQLTNSAGQYGSSDDDDDEWESVPQRDLGFKGLDGSDDDDDDDDESSEDLTLVRSRSYGH